MRSSPPPRPRPSSPVCAGQTDSSVGECTRKGTPHTTHHSPSPPRPHAKEPTPHTHIRLAHHQRAYPLTCCTLALRPFQLPPWLRMLRKLTLLTNRGLISFLRHSKRHTKRHSKRYTHRTLHTAHRTHRTARTAQHIPHITHRTSHAPHIPRVHAPHITARTSHTPHIVRTAQHAPHSTYDTSNTAHRTHRTSHTAHLTHRTSHIARTAQHTPHITRIARTSHHATPRHATRHATPLPPPPPQDSIASIACDTEVEERLFAVEVENLRLRNVEFEQLRVELETTRKKLELADQEQIESVVLMLIREVEFAEQCAKLDGQSECARQELALAQAAAAGRRYSRIRLDRRPRSWCQTVWLEARPQ